jgi:hypothetical protein
MLKIEISGESKEIADLVVALQDRQQVEIFPIHLDVANGNTDDLVVENNKQWQGGFCGLC